VPRRHGAICAGTCACTTLRGNPKRKYLAVTLSRGSVTQTRAVHQLVLESFVGPRPDGALGCHWDDDHENNDLSNLRWCTPLANAHDRARNCRLRRALAVIQTW
jgi:HNH endonuclease